LTGTIAMTSGQDYLPLYIGLLGSLSVLGGYYLNHYLSGRSDKQKENKELAEAKMVAYMDFIEAFSNPMPPVTTDSVDSSIYRLVIDAESPYIRTAIKLVEFEDISLESSQDLAMPIISSSKAQKLIDKREIKLLSDFIKVLLDVRYLRDISVKEKCNIVESVRKFGAEKFGVLLLDKIKNRDRT